MIYEFDGGSFGRCFVESFTSGLHGFAKPKMFKITSAEGRFAAAHTIQFSDKLLSDLRAATPGNAVLCRIAVAQFLGAPIDPRQASVATLNLAVAPFDGALLNGRSVSTGAGCMPRPESCASDGSGHHD